MTSARAIGPSKNNFRRSFIYSLGVLNISRQPFSFTTDKRSHILTIAASKDDSDLDGTQTIATN